MIFSNEPISVTNSSCEDFRNTAAMYFLTGNRFPIDLPALGHSVDRFREVKVSEARMDPNEH